MAFRILSHVYQLRWGRNTSWNGFSSKSERTVGGGLHFKIGCKDRSKLKIASNCKWKWVKTLVRMCIVNQPDLPGVLDSIFVAVKENCMNSFITDRIE